MSLAAKWTYINPATIWPTTVSEFGGVSYGSPYLIYCDYEIGGEMAISDAGDQFGSKSKYYFQAYPDDPIIPQMNWMVALGDHTASSLPVESAERIQRVGGWGNPLDATENDRIFYT